MKKIALLASAVVLPLAVPGVAQAQESTGARPYVEVQAGLHDLNVNADTSTRPVSTSTIPL